MCDRGGSVHPAIVPLGRLLWQVWRRRAGLYHALKFWRNYLKCVYNMISFINLCWICVLSLFSINVHWNKICGNILWQLWRRHAGLYCVLCGLKLYRTKLYFCLTLYLYKCLFKSFDMCWCCVNYIIFDYIVKLEFCHVNDSWW